MTEDPQSGPTHMQEFERAPKHPDTLVAQRDRDRRMLLTGSVGVILGLVFVASQMPLFAALFGGGAALAGWVRMLLKYRQSSRRLREYEEAWEAHPDWAFEQLFAYHRTAEEGREGELEEVKASQAKHARLMAVLGVATMISIAVGTGVGGAIAQAVMYAMIAAMVAGLIVYGVAFNKTQERVEDLQVIEAERAKVRELAGAQAASGGLSEAQPSQRGQLSESIEQDDSSGVALCFEQQAEHVEQVREVEHGTKTHG